MFAILSANDYNINMQILTNWMLQNCIDVHLKMIIIITAYFVSITRSEINAIKD